MADHSIPREFSGPVEVSGYVASLAAELASMARQAGLGSLEYLLQMVRLEAENLHRQAREDDKG